MSGDKRKKSLYLPEELVREIAIQAERLDRSESWIIQASFRIALARIKAMPAPTMEVV